MIRSVKTFPGIVTAVAGRCEVTFDQRDLDANVLAEMSFYTRGKIVTSRWPDPSASKVDLRFSQVR